jgi:hypothetical protein
VSNDTVIVWTNVSIAPSLIADPTGYGLPPDGAAGYFTNGDSILYESGIFPTLCPPNQWDTVDGVDPNPGTYCAVVVVNTTNYVPALSANGRRLLSEFNDGGVYVNATFGNDDTAGYSPITPFKTVTAGIAALGGASNKVVHVSAGTYHEQVLLDTGQSLIGAGSGLTFIDKVQLHSSTQLRGVSVTIATTPIEIGGENIYLEDVTTTAGMSDGIYLAGPYWNGLRCRNCSLYGSLNLIADDNGVPGISNQVGEFYNCDLHCIYNPNSISPYVAPIALIAGTLRFFGGQIEAVNGPGYNTCIYIYPQGSNSAQVELSGTVLRSAVTNGTAWTVYCDGQTGATNVTTYGDFIPTNTIYGGKIRVITSSGASVWP